MIKDLTLEQQEVLIEFVELSKGGMERYHLSAHAKAMFYDFKMGKSKRASIELLNTYFYELIETQELTSEQCRRLAHMLLEREREGIIEDDPFEKVWVKKINEQPTNGKEFL